MSKRAAGAVDQAEKMEEKWNTMLKNHTDELFGKLRDQFSEVKKEIGSTQAAVTSLQQAMGAAFEEVNKKVSAVTSVVQVVQQRQQLLDTAVTGVQAVLNSRAFLELRSNTLFVSAVPFTGRATSQTVEAAFRKELADAGVPFVASGMETGKVWSLSLLSFGPSRKQPGTYNGVVQVLTANERRLIVTQQVTANLNAKGIGISTDLTAEELRNKSQLFAHPQFKAALEKADSIRAARGPQACTKRWVLDRCILGTGNGRETVEWSVAHLAQLAAQQRTAAAAAAAGQMAIDLANI